MSRTETYRQLLSLRFTALVLVMMMIIPTALPYFSSDFDSNDISVVENQFENDQEQETDTDEEDQKRGSEKFFDPNDYVQEYQLNCKGSFAAYIFRLPNIANCDIHLPPPEHKLV